MFDVCDGAYLTAAVGKSNIAKSNLIYIVNRSKNFFD